MDDEIDKLSLELCGFENFGSCRSCRYFDHIDWDAAAGVDVGWCERYPPARGVRTDVDSDSQEAFEKPQTRASDWCGEWRAIKMGWAQMTVYRSIARRVK